MFTCGGAPAAAALASTPNAPAATSAIALVREAHASARAGPDRYGRLDDIFVVLSSMWTGTDRQWAKPTPPACSDLDHQFTVSVSFAVAVSLVFFVGGAGWHGAKPLAE
jgi:hypothetical protein